MNRMKLRATLAPILLITALALTTSQRADAVVTARWVVSSYTSFDEGEGESVLITSEGEVKPGWSTARTEMEGSATWAAVRLADGSIVVGTDDEGALYRIAGDKASKLTSIENAVAVVALAVDAKGTLYAGTMPNGEIWTVDAKSGKASKLVALPEAETVWSLAFDHAGSKLYAGTGPDGKLFEVDPASGKAKVAFATEDTRVMALAATTDGAIWLGTSEEALVFRYDPKQGSARAMADFDGNEVTALAARGTGVVAAANNFAEVVGTGARTAEAVKKGTDEEKKQTAGEKPKLPKPGTEPGADKPEPANAKLPRKGGRKGKGALYRIDGDSRLEQLHALTETYFTSVAIDERGRVFAGAGDKGRIYMVDADDAVATAFDVSERMIANVLTDGSGLAFTTADGAAVYRATGAAAKAVYTSDVQDTKASSRFGRIQWRGAGNLKVETRTGNTAKPGIGWSPWVAPAKRGPAGGESWAGRIASPPGRYIQYRVTFDGDEDAVLRATTVYHLPQNRPTTVTEIELDDDQKIAITQTDAAKPRSPVIKVKWKVENPDEDETIYTLAVRREGDVQWRRLVSKDGKPITKKEHEWNTETFPDGYYQLRVTASDHLANAADRALRTQRTTPLFVVDNDKPALSGISVNYPRASARATDAISSIAKAAYSVDDGPWQLAGADDELFDSQSEILTFSLPRDLAPGVHTFAIRVADEAGNIGSASVTFRVK